MAVKRNIDKFPNDFYFRLDLEEFKKLRFQNETTNYNMIRNLPYVFTEEGVATLASVLRTKVANEVVSFNHIGSKTFSINILEDDEVKTALINKINELSHL